MSVNIIIIDYLSEAGTAISHILSEQIWALLAIHQQDTVYKHMLWNTMKYKQQTSSTILSPLKRKDPEYLVKILSISKSTCLRALNVGGDHPTGTLVPWAAEEAEGCLAFGQNVGRYKHQEQERGTASAVSVSKAVPWACRGSTHPARVASVRMWRGSQDSWCGDETGHLSHQSPHVRLPCLAAQTSNSRTLGASLGCWRPAQLQLGSRHVACQDIAQSAIISAVLQAV